MGQFSAWHCNPGFSFQIHDAVIVVTSFLKPLLTPTECFGGHGLPCGWEGIQCVCVWGGDKRDVASLACQEMFPASSEPGVPPPACQSPTQAAPCPLSPHPLCPHFLAGAGVCAWMTYQQRMPSTFPLCHLESSMMWVTSVACSMGAPLSFARTWT